jgi:hypothetical protein
MLQFARRNLSRDYVGFRFRFKKSNLYHEEREAIRYVHRTRYQWGDISMRQCKWPGPTPWNCYSRPVLIRTCTYSFSSKSVRAIRHCACHHPGLSRFPCRGRRSAAARQREVAATATLQPRTQSGGKLGDLVKDQVCNRPYPSLRKLEDRIIAALRPWRTDGPKMAELIGDGWLLNGLNNGAPT